MIKAFKKITALVVLLVGSNISSAEMLEQWPGFYGVEYKHSFMKGAGQWQRVFVDNHPGINLFIGGKFHTNVGFEFGYSWTMRDSKHLKLQPAEYLFGSQNTSGGIMVLDSKVRLKNTYFDFNFYYPLASESITAIGAVGLQSSRQHVTISTNTSGTPVDSYVNNVKGKTRIIPRLNAGVEWMFDKSWGIRALYHFEHTSDVRFRGATDDHEKPFENTHALSFGVVWSF